MTRTKISTIEPGNIDIDPMIRMLPSSRHLKTAALVGIEPTSAELTCAARTDVQITSDGGDELIGMDGSDEIETVFDATSASAHAANTAKFAPYGKRLIDRTPSAHTDPGWTGTAATVVKNARLTTPLLPAIGAVENFERTYDLGMPSVRLATHATEADIGAQHSAQACVGRGRIVGRQEDMIGDIAFDLTARRDCTDAARTATEAERTGASV